MSVLTHSEAKGKGISPKLTHTLQTVYGMICGNSKPQHRPLPRLPEELKKFPRIDISAAFVDIGN